MWEETINIDQLTITIPLASTLKHVVKKYTDVNSWGSSYQFGYWILDLPTLFAHTNTFTFLSCHCQQDTAENDIILSSGPICDGEGSFEGKDICMDIWALKNFKDNDCDQKTFIEDDYFQ